MIINISVECSKKLQVETLLSTCVPWYECPLANLAYINHETGGRISLILPISMKKGEKSLQNQLQGIWPGLFYFAVICWLCDSEEQERTVLFSTEVHQSCNDQSLLGPLLHNDRLGGHFSLKIRENSKIIQDAFAAYRLEWCIDYNFENNL